MAAQGRFLDPRPAEQALAQPYQDACNIPLAELVDRVHELPPKEETVLLLECAETRQARETLEAGGRRVQTVPGRPADIFVLKRLWRPNAFLEEVSGSLSGGLAADLGCGVGREAVFIAGLGFKVQAFDVLADALAKGEDLARRYLGEELQQQEPIQWIPRNVETDGLPELEYDLVTSFRFLHRPLLEQIESHLARGGSLVVETFTILHRDRHGKPKSDKHILQLGELPSLVPSLQIERYDEGWRGESHTARIWAKKR